MRNPIYFLLLIGSILTFNRNTVAQSNAPQTAQLQNRIVDSLFSETLNESRDFWVRLPENFQPNSDEKYPVVYLMDGFSLESNLLVVYENYWGITFLI
ncbi:alpha/beta hydrolase-fold protein [Persicobacter sp. CCB-QB2]|uniref:alpha/beta hydrolase-fold protein n=1 Tax=Persicobacter sp. CCB-QB2 TaxID=1561025 RepID=UPI000A5867F6